VYRFGPPGEATISVDPPVLLPAAAADADAAGAAPDAKLDGVLADDALATPLATALAVTIALSALAEEMIALACEGDIVVVIAAVPISVPLTPVLEMDETAEAEALAALAELALTPALETAELLAAVAVATTDELAAETMLVDAGALAPEAGLFELLLEELVPPEDIMPEIAISARASGSESIKTMAGPATIVLVFCSRMSLSMGWSSDVMNKATGPLIPAGTTQLSKGKEIEKAAPPMIIWQK